MNQMNLKEADGNVFNYNIIIINNNQVTNVRKKNSRIKMIDLIKLLLKLIIG